MENTHKTIECIQSDQTLDEENVGKCDNSEENGVLGPRVLTPTTRVVEEGTIQNAVDAVRKIALVTLALRYCCEHVLSPPYNSGLTQRTLEHAGFQSLHVSPWWAVQHVEVLAARPVLLTLFAVFYNSRGGGRGGRDGGKCISHTVQSGGISVFYCLLLSGVFWFSTPASNTHKHMYVPYSCVMN